MTFSPQCRWCGNPLDPDDIDETDRACNDYAHKFCRTNWEQDGRARIVDVCGGCGELIEDEEEWEEAPDRAGGWHRRCVESMKALSDLGGEFGLDRDAVHNTSPEALRDWCDVCDRDFDPKFPNMFRCTNCGRCTGCYSFAPCNCDDEWG
jgi:hypothetical protein